MCANFGHAIKNVSRIAAATKALTLSRWCAAEIAESDCGATTSGCIGAQSVISDATTANGTAQAEKG